MVVRVPGEVAVHEEEEALGKGHEGAKSRIMAIDFRETSPEKSEKEMYGTKRAGRVAAQVGGLAIGVPGELRGLEAGKCLSPQVRMYVVRLERGDRSRLVVSGTS
jgi:gamma-glutamyltranspeptidase/glutathione hydrolase/leukotriene-C4 hydrolase